MGAGYAGADFIEGFAGRYFTGDRNAQPLPTDAAQWRDEVRQIAAEGAKAALAGSAAAAPAPTMGMLAAPARDEPAAG